MAKFTVIPENTFDTLQLDAGVILKTFTPSSPQTPADADIVCATTGGITVTCVPSFEDMGEDVDNCPTNMLELKKLSGWECTMSFTSLRVDADAVKLALGAATLDSASGKVVPKRDLSKSDFSDIWWVGDTADGGCVAVRLINALSTGGFNLKTSKNGKGQLTVELTGHVSIDAQDVMPFEFWYKKAST